MPHVPVIVQNDVGRRERKKRAVRDALVDAALDLFEQQGVDETTVEQMSDAVDVSARTFHRHFPSKLDVLFADAEDLRSRFESALAQRPPGEDVLRSLREAMSVLTDTMAARRHREVTRQRIIESHDGLRAINLRRSEEWAESVARHSAMRLGVADDELLPRLLGGCAVAALRTARARWMDDPRIDLTADLRQCFALMSDMGAATTRERR